LRHIEEVLILMAQEDTGASPAIREGSDEAEPALRGGGLRLPGLKYWRLRRGLHQTWLAELAGTNQRYISRIEAGERGCNPNVAQKLAEILEVDLEALRSEVEPEPPARPRKVYRRVHGTYLRIILQMEVGSAYTALGERGLELHCRKLSWEGVLEVVSARKREAEVIREILRDADLSKEVRRFLEAAVGGYPDQDVRILTVTRRREGSKKGREELARAVREIL
jgi:transcriptional regulator with XRE-family HTH domain